MDKPMEHLKLWHNLYAGILMPSETALYIHLVMVANSRFWPDWIELTDSQLSLGTNISIKRIPDAINSLVQKKLIESKRGKGKNPSQYNICPLPNYTQMGIINGRKTGDKQEINGRKTGDKREKNGRLEKNSPCGSKDGEGSKTNTKDKDTTYYKESKEKAAKKFVPPTLEEIKAYCQENNLSVNPSDFYNYFNDTGWIDSKGQKVVSWKGKLRTWEKYQPKGGVHNERRNGRTLGESEAGEAEKERADAFREECRQADANQIYPWEIQNPA